MIIVKGASLEVEGLEEADSILFVGEGGEYDFVESGLVENELRVIENWKTTGRPRPLYPWVIAWDQGTRIPQELGDYLVALGDLEAKATIVRRGVVDVSPDEDWSDELKDAYLTGSIDAVFECGEILSKPLPRQDYDQTTDSAEKTNDQSDD